MKSFMAILIIMAVSFGTAGAAPATPAWTASGAVSGVNGQSFNTYPLTVNWTFPMNENWWVTAGYRGGLRQFPVINAGVAYNVSPNVAVSIGYILETKYDLKNAVFRTQLDVLF